VNQAAGFVGFGRAVFGRAFVTAGDEPMHPWTVEWELSREGWKLLFGAESAAEEEWRFASWRAPDPEKRERRVRKRAAG
jgi:hypothetical protein